MHINSNPVLNFLCWGEAKIQTTPTSTAVQSLHPDFGRMSKLQFKSFHCQPFLTTVNIFLHRMWGITSGHCAYFISERISLIFLLLMSECNVKNCTLCVFFNEYRNDNHLKSSKNAYFLSQITSNFSWGEWKLRKTLLHHLLYKSQEENCCI